MKKKITVGSRESRLAVAQTQLVIDEIRKHNPDIEIELVTMKTTGDIILDRTLDKVGGKGLFVKELDRALKDGRVDITVHSLKDMPADPDPELPLLAFFRRGNPYDCLVEAEGMCAGESLKKPFGSSSGRRNIQIKEIFGDVECLPVRGNVLTRLEKLDSGMFGNLVLARAGLERLGLEDRITRTFTHEEMIPAAGQGILVVQGRAGEDYSWLKPVDDADSRDEAEAERSFIRTLDGGCSSPVGAFAQVNGDEITVYGMYVNVDTGDYRKGHATGPREKGAEIGRNLAVRLREETDGKR